MGEMLEIIFDVFLRRVALNRVQSRTRDKIIKYPLEWITIQKSALSFFGTIILLISVQGQAVGDSYFEKHGNNGSVSCNEFCANTRANWGPVGTCVGGRIEQGPGAGGNIPCDNGLGVLGSVVCYCKPPAQAPTGSFEKPGNNGSVSCNEFCSNTRANWGPVGTCTGGRIEQGPGAGGNIPCDNGLGVLGSMVCYCKPCQASGLTECGDHCIALNHDSQNCGSCGNVCTGGMTCQNGSCGCSAPYTNCGGTCKNLSNDPQNCGGCNKVCATGQSCCSGKCTDLSSDVHNCGACGHACENTCSQAASCTKSSCGDPVKSFTMYFADSGTKCALAGPGGVGVLGASYRATSQDQAKSCAQRDHPGLLVGASYTPFTWYADCAGYCYSFSWATLSASDAQSCMQSRYGRCAVSSSVPSECQ